MSDVAAQPAATRSLGFGAQLATLLGVQTRLVLRQRKTRAIFIVQLLPVLAALVYVGFESVDGLTMFSGIVDNITIPLLVPLAAIFFGGPAVVEELEGRTLTYLTLRPVGKGTLFVGKALAATLICLPTVLIPLLALFLLCLWESPDWGVALGTLGPTVGAIALGTVTYTLLFAALGAAFASGLLVSIVYFLVVEIGFGVLPVLEVASVRFHIRTAGQMVSDQPGLLDRVVLGDKPIVLDWYWGVAILSVVALAALGIGAWVFRERQYHV